MAETVVLPPVTNGNNNIDNPPLTTKGSGSSGSSEKLNYGQVLAMLYQFIALYNEAISKTNDVQQSQIKSGYDMAFKAAGQQGDAMINQANGAMGQAVLGLIGAAAGFVVAAGGLKTALTTKIDDVTAPIVGAAADAGGALGGAAENAAGGIARAAPGGGVNSGAFDGTVGGVRAAAEEAAVQPAAAGAANAPAAEGAAAGNGQVAQANGAAQQAQARTQVMVDKDTRVLQQRLLKANTKAQALNGAGQGLGGMINSQYTETAGAETKTSGEQKALADAWSSNQGLTKGVLDSENGQFNAANQAVESLNRTMEKSAM